MRRIAGALLAGMTANLVKTANAEPADGGFR
jgi:hypothetical protein